MRSMQDSLEEHSGATLSRAPASAQYSKPLISREQCQASHQSRAVYSLSCREHSLEEHSGATLSRALASAQYSKPLISREQCQASHQSRAVYSLSLVESSKRAT
jgi:cytochrome c551/c552